MASVGTSGRPSHLPSLRSVAAKLDHLVMRARHRAIACQKIRTIGGDLAGGIDRQRPLAPVLLVGLPGRADEIAFEEAELAAPTDRSSNGTISSPARNIADEGMIEDDQIVGGEHRVERALAEFIEAAAVPFDLEAGMGGAIRADAGVERSPATSMIPRQTAQSSPYSGNSSLGPGIDVRPAD